MSCKKNCKINNIVFSFTIGGIPFVLDGFINDGDAIAFSADEFEADIKLDSKGDTYISSGQPKPWKIFTVNTFCSVSAVILDEYWSLNGVECGDGVMITDCCRDYVFDNLILEGLTPPNIGNTVGQYEFNFRATLGA